MSLAKLRPELDLFLMTEIEVEDIAGRLGQHFRRVFHAREGVLELHLSILQARRRASCRSGGTDDSCGPAHRRWSGG